MSSKHSKEKILESLKNQLDDGEKVISYHVGMYCTKMAPTMFLTIFGLLFGIIGVTSAGKKNIFGYCYIVLTNKRILVSVMNLNYTQCARLFALDFGDIVKAKGGRAVASPYEVRFWLKDGSKIWFSLPTNYYNKSEEEENLAIFDSFIKEKFSSK